MKINEVKIKIKDLYKNWSDNDDNGIYAYNGLLTVRPAFQREFVYDDKKRNAVIDTVRKGFPLNTMYWSKVVEDGKVRYELLDGQQRTISICRYIQGDYSVNHRFYHNLTSDEQEKLDNYELTIYICEGDEKEKLDWFRVINIAGEVLKPQELLNAVYTGTWLSDAKRYFSKRKCVAIQKGADFIKGNPIRQDLLEKCLKWIAENENLDTVEDYMALHQHDKDANALWTFFQKVVDWAKMLFPDVNKKFTENQNWGHLYKLYSNNTYNTNDLKKDFDALLLDDDVENKAGIIPYLLSKRTLLDENILSLRTFTTAQKLKAYEQQEHKCAVCGETFALDEMEGDHIIPWSKGGKTVPENLQMLCKTCNRIKSNK